MAVRRKGAFLGIFDVPLYKDWILYLWALAVVVGISSSGILLALVVQTFLFAFVPAWIREQVRGRARSTLPPPPPPPR